MPDALTGRALDAAMCALLEPKPQGVPKNFYDVSPGGHWGAGLASGQRVWRQRGAPSESLDAALLAYRELRDKRWPGALLIIREAQVDCWNTQMEVAEGVYFSVYFGDANTPARAVCLVLLRAAEVADGQ